MARGAGGILVGFEGGFDPLAISEQGLDKTIALRRGAEQTNFNRDVTDQEQGRATERQSWERQMQPIKMQQALGQEQERQQRMAEVDRKVKRETDARQKFEAVTSRFGTDNPPTHQELFEASINALLTKGDFDNATKAMSDMITYQRGGEEADALGELQMEIGPAMLDGVKNGWTEERVAKVGQVLHKNRKAGKSSLYTAGVKHYHEAIDKVLPAEVADALKGYDQMLGAGIDPIEAMNRTRMSYPGLRDWMVSNKAKAKEFFPEYTEDLTAGRQAKRVQASEAAKQTRVLETQREAHKQKLEQIRATGEERRKSIAATGATKPKKSEIPALERSLKNRITDLSKEIAAAEKNIRALDGDELAEETERLGQLREERDDARTRLDEVGKMILEREDPERASDIENKAKERKAKQPRPDVVKAGKADIDAAHTKFGKKLDRAALERAIDKQVAAGDMNEAEADQLKKHLKTKK